MQFFSLSFLSSISSMFRVGKSGRERSWVRQQRKNISVLFYPTESRSRAHFVETTGCEFFSPSDTQSEMMMRLLLFFWEENASLSRVYTDQRRRVRGITPTKVVEWSGKESEENFTRISKKSSSTSLRLPSSTGRLNWTRRLSEWKKEKIYPSYSIGMAHIEGDGISSCRTKRREMEIFHKNERAKPTILLGCHELQI